MDNNTLQFVIKAVDDATLTLQQVKQAVDSLASSTDKASTSSGNLSDAGKAQGDSFLSLAGSIFTGTEAVNLFNDALSAGKEFLMDSINTSIQASATMAQVRVDVNNAGLSYSTLAPQLQAVAEQNVALGFTQEETQLSMGKLILATGSYSQALEINQLAMDLSRAKGIDLNDATTMLQQVMAGNTRVLKQYGISLDSATTSGEALQILHEKLQGSAQAFGDTAAGKAAEVSAQWDEMKKEVGDQLMPELEKLFAAFEEALPTIEALLKTTVELISELTDMVMTYINNVKNAIGAIEDEYHSLIGTTQQVANSQVQLSSGIDAVIAKFNTLHPNAQITDADFKQMDFTEQKAIITAVQHANAIDGTTTAAKKASSGFDDVTNHIKSATTAVTSHADALVKLTDEYGKMNTSAQSDIDSLTSDFTTKMASINASIKNTTQSITDLQTSYSQQTGDQTASVADQIVASEKKIADIKTQLAASTDATTTASLQTQLAAEQANYDSSLTFRQNNVAAMTAAEQRGTETALQLSIDQYNTQQSQEAQAFQQKMSDLQSTLSAEQAEAAQETQIYNDKMAAIATVLKTAQDTFIQQSKDRQAQTTTEVDAEIAAYQALAAEIAAVNSAKSTTAISHATSLPARASGGSVSAGQPYLVGEMGAEVFVPNGAGSIVPNNKLGGGGNQNIVVNVTGTFMSSDAARQMGDLIVRNLQRVSKVSLQ